MPPPHLISLFVRFLSLNCDLNRNRLIHNDFLGRSDRACSDRTFWALSQENVGEASLSTRYCFTAILWQHSRQQPNVYFCHNTLLYIVFSTLHGCQRISRPHWTPKYWRPRSIFEPVCVSRDLPKNDLHDRWHQYNRFTGQKCDCVDDPGKIERTDSHGLAESAGLQCQVIPVAFLRTLPLKP